MGGINFFPNDLEVKDQKIILRLDLNVPIQDKIIKTQFKLYPEHLIAMKKVFLLMVNIHHVIVILKIIKNLSGN